MLIKNSFIASLVLFSITTFAQPRYPGTITKLKQAIPVAMANENILGASIALIDKDGVIWSEGFGYTDSLKAKAVTPNTLFSIGSDSKMFTCLGFFRASQDGKISLDDQLLKYYPDFKINSRYGDDEAGKITFRHLLSHRAGLLHETPLGGNYDNTASSLSQHVQSISGGWLKAKVGSRYCYSNLDVDLVGYCLQNISGERFDLYIKNKVFLPLNMNSSTVSCFDAAKNPDFAKGYYYGSEVAPKQSAVTPSGNMFSNVADVANLVSMFYNDGKVGGKKLFSLKNLDEMSRVQFSDGKEKKGYGLCLATMPFFNAGKLIFHSGSGWGYSSKIGWLPGHKLGVVVLCNADEVAFCENMLQEALKLMLSENKVNIVEETPDDAGTQTADSAKLVKFTGRYKSFYTVENIALKGDTLFWVKNPRYKIKLKAINDSTLLAGNEKLIFRFDKTGQPVSVFYKNFKEVDTWFLNDKPGETAGPDNAAWAKFEGKYQFNIYGQFGFLVSIAKRNGYLYCSKNGGIKLQAYKDNIFFTPDGEAVIFEDGKMLFGGRPALKVN